MKKLLLHICCAPCMAYVVELLSRDFSLTAFYYNPNIYPGEEYKKRFSEVQKFCRGMNLPLIESVSPPEFWQHATRGMAQEKEGGKRCFSCFALRLKATAEKARELKFDFFSTVLSISPHKNSQTINTIGQTLSADIGVKFYAADFKKKDGFKKAMDKAKELGFYRQNYCGCIYSIRKENQNSGGSK